MHKDSKIIDGILKILVDREVITKDDADSLKKEYTHSEAERFEDYLIDEKLVEKEDLLKALQEYYNVPAMDVMGEMFDHVLLRNFPKDVLLRNCCIPYREDGDILFVVTSDPNNEDLDEILGEFSPNDFEYFVGIPRHIDMMIKDFYEHELYTQDYEDIVDEAERQEEIINIDDDEVVHRDEEGRDDGEN